MSTVMFLTALVPMYKELFSNRGNNYFDKVRNFDDEYMSSTITMATLMQQIALIDKVPLI